jgi:long-subunit fatty acid transport protein
MGRVARLLALAVPVAAAFACSDARANPLDAFGFGSRQAGMGNAVSADVSDFSACYYNPAGLALAHGMEISVGYFRADHYLYMNGQNSGVDPVKGTVGGAVVPGKLYGVPFAFGVAFHIPDNWLTRVRALPQDEPRWEMYDNRNQRLWFGVDAAVSPTPWLQIGGGVTFMAATTATLDISGNIDVGAPLNSYLRHEVDADVTMIAYPAFGARIEASKELSFALVYRGQFKENLVVDANVQAGASAFLPPGDLTTLKLGLQTDTVDAFLPQQVVIGTSWKPTENLHANLDLTWVNWNSYIPPVSVISTQLDLPAPAGGWAALGVQPPTVPAPITITPIVMHNTVVPRVGIQWRAFERRTWEGFVRGGYEYVKSPIGPQTGSTNYVDRDRHSISAGLGVRLIAPGKVIPGDVRFDAHTQLSVLPTSTTIKADPSDPVGDYTAGGHIWNVGVTATVSF